MTAPRVILEARELTKTFDGHVAVDDVDLRVREGELLSVMGPSGSGKSTLLYTISGMDTMSSGHVTFAGQQLERMSHKQLARLRLTTMGFVFQHVHLLRNLCLLDNVVLPAYLAGLAPRRVLNERALELMERTGVGALADRDVTEASGGQLQRIGICRALINDPRIVFGDEPTGALDSDTAAGIMDLLCELNASGTTVVLVTHDARVAARTLRVLYMVDGRIVADRDQGPSTGTDPDQRHTDLVQWLLDQSGGGQPTGSTGSTAVHVPYSTLPRQA